MGKSGVSFFLSEQTSKKYLNINDKRPSHHETVLCQCACSESFGYTGNMSLTREVWYLLWITKYKVAPRLHVYFSANARAFSVNRRFFLFFIFSPSLSENSSKCASSLRQQPLPHPQCHGQAMVTSSKRGRKPAPADKARTARIEGRTGKGHQIPAWMPRERPRQKKKKERK